MTFFNLSLNTVKKLRCNTAGRLCRGLVTKSEATCTRKVYGENDKVTLGPPTYTIFSPEVCLTLKLKRDELTGDNGLLLTGMTRLKDGSNSFNKNSRISSVLPMETLDRLSEAITKNSEHPVTFEGLDGGSVVVTNNSDTFSIKLYPSLPGLNLTPGMLPTTKPNSHINFTGNHNEHALVKHALHDLSSSNYDKGLYPDGIKKPSSYCHRELDLTILVDESSSIYIEEWNKLIPFLKSLVRSINISPNYVHLSMVTFSTSIRWLISFLDPASKDEQLALAVLDKLKNSKPVFGYTFTGQALNFISEAVYMFGARRNSPKGIIIITDGSSTQTNVTSQASALLRDAGVTILVVGVGKAKESECRGIVGCSTKGECPLFFMTNWDEIIRKVGELMAEVCETIPKDAVCKPIWSDWSKCDAKCGIGTRYQKLMGVTTISEPTVGTNGKSGRTCEMIYENVEVPKEECSVECDEQGETEGSLDEKEEELERMRRELEEYKEMEGNERMMEEEMERHQKDHDEYEEESSSSNEEYSRGGAKIAGGVALALLMLAGGGGYTYYKKYGLSRVSETTNLDEDFADSSGNRGVRESVGEAYTVTDLDDGLWSQSNQ
ncbi:thrombospondin-related protein, putative [Theileria annulata]|uniref:Thrombospondin-related protein, putative n=1 Tax=Theileria annulata TaxID=5874 RepID=Q464T5_THEAN|nr:thrombospondin-related protein, putative [Theileria annulata]CAJ20069.1 thrombospondin-related protein, putative [Theileria annulata]|eukprot:XP_952977.1 thrombospondin-related protein, putative [Theileria annulata]